MQTLLAGGPTELEMNTAAAIRGLTRTPVINAVGKTSLKTLPCLIRDARLVVASAPDSGPIHMAVAMQTPALGLYFTSNPDRTGPWLGREFVVNRYPDAVKAFLDKDVNEVGWGQRVRDPAALDLITQEDVRARLDAIMASEPRLTVKTTLA